MARRWTPEEDDELVALYTSGQRVVDIAERLGRTADAVSERRRTLGLAPRTQARPWTADEDRFLLGLHDAGFPATVAADRLRRPDDQVRRRLNRLRPERPTAEYRQYSAAEDDLVRAAFAEGHDLTALAERLERRVTSLYARGARLGVYQPARRSRWLPEEDAIIRHGYSRGLSCEAIASELSGRTPATVASRASKIGVTTYARAWTSRDDARLKELLLEDTPAELIAAELGRTPEALRQRARRLGIAWPLQSHRAQHRRPWTPADEALLRQHAHLNPAALSRLLRRSPAAIVQRRRILGLRSTGRSPHHPAYETGDGLTPAQLAVIERELRDAGPRRAMAVARRLGVSVAEVQRAAAR